MQEGYRSLQETCRMQVEVDENHCDGNDRVGDIRDHYQGLYTGFQQDCKKTYCQNNHLQEESVEDCLVRIADTREEQWKTLWPQAAQVAYAQGNPADAGRDPQGDPIEKIILTDIHYYRYNDQAREDYLPQMLKNQDYEDETHNAHVSVINTMDQNRTM